MKKLGKRSLKLKRSPIKTVKRKVVSGSTKVFHVSQKKPITLTVGKNKESFVNRHRRIFPKYFKESWEELGNVTWPKRRQAIGLTISVTIFVLMFTLITAAADYGLNKAAERIFLK